MFCGFIVDARHVRAFATSMLLALLGVSGVMPRAYALPDELEVHLDDINKPGQFGFEAISSYAASGPRQPSDQGLHSSVHLLQVSPVLSYGIANNMQLGLQLFSSVTSSGNARVDGERFEFLTLFVKPPEDEGDGIFLGSLIEFGKLPATLSPNKLDAEIKGILGYRSGQWLFAANPEIGFKVSGSGSSRPDLSIRAKAAYQVSQKYSVGIEQYSDLGQLSHVGPLNQQSQQTFAVIDFKAKDMDFNVGIGRGWNDFSERWVLKAIVAIPFGK